MPATKAEEEASLSRVVGLADVVVVVVVVALTKTDKIDPRRATSFFGRLNFSSRFHFKSFNRLILLLLLLSARTRIERQTLAAAAEFSVNLSSRDAKNDQLAARPQVRLIWPALCQCLDGNMGPNIMNLGLLLLSC